MARIGELRAALAIVVLFTAHSNADEAVDKIPIPVLGQPTKHFYNAAGTGVTVRAEATPTSVPLHRWLTYTLTISNLVNAADVEKPSLKMLVEFQEFQIEEGANLDPPLDPAHKDRRVFVYRLRPNAETVDHIPEIEMYYFDPKVVVPDNQPQARFRKAISKLINIQVLPAEKPPAAEPMPLQVPKFAERYAYTETSSADFQLVSLAIVVLPLAPVLAIGWIIVWRKLHPHAARLRRIRQNAAVRQALDALARADNQGAGPIMIRYLRERFGLPSFAQTPKEIDSSLQQSGVNDQHRSRIVAFLRECDMLRFSPGRDRDLDLVAEANDVLVALEASA